MAFVQEAGPIGRGDPQRGVVPTRRALFPTRLQEADQWSVAASRNLDAPEMGSPPNSDDEEGDEDGDDSSSDSSSEVSRSTLSSSRSNRAILILQCVTVSTVKLASSASGGFFKVCSPFVPNIVLSQAMGSMSVISLSLQR